MLKNTSMKAPLPGYRMAGSIASLLFVASSTAWGSIGSCNATPSPPATQTPGVTLQAGGYIGGGDGVNGCATIDYRWSNFSVGSSSSTETINGIDIAALVTATPITSVPTASAIYQGVSSLNPSLISLMSPGPDLAAGASTNFCDQNGGTGGWCVQNTDQMMVSTITYTLESLTGDLDYLGFAGTLISHSSGGGAGVGGATALAFREICIPSPGQTSFSQIGCAQYGVVQGGIQNSQFETTAFSGAIQIIPGQTLAYIRDTVVLSTDNGAGSWAALVYLDTIDTPEPATWSLMGSSLFFLIALAIRRQRRGQSS